MSEHRSSYWQLASGVVQQVVAVEQTAVRQAFYNTVANLFLILTLWAFFVLYFVFEQFVRPLLWAVTVGVFLHPLKQEAIRRIRTWLCQLMETDTPLLLGFLTLPFKLLTITEELVKQRWGRFFLFAAVLFCLFALDTVQQVVISTFLFLRGSLYLFVWLVEMTVGYFFLHYSFIRSCLYPLLAGYLIIAFLCWRYHFPRVLRAVNIVMWCLALTTLLPFLVEYLGMWPFLVGAAATLAVAIMGCADRGGLSWEGVLREYKNQSQKKDDDDTSTTGSVPAADVGGGSQEMFGSDEEVSTMGNGSATASGGPRARDEEDAANLDDDDRVQDEFTSAEICMLLFVSCLAVTFWEWVPWLLVWGWIFSVLKWLVRTYIDFGYIKQVLLLFLVYQFLRRGQEPSPTTANKTKESNKNRNQAKDQTRIQEVEEKAEMEAHKNDPKQKQKTKKKVTLKSMEDEDEDGEGLMFDTTVIHTQEIAKEKQKSEDDDRKNGEGDKRFGNDQGKVDKNDARADQGDRKGGEVDKKEKTDDEWTPHKVTTVRIKRSFSAPLRKIVFYDTSPPPQVAPRSPFGPIGAAPTLEHSVSFDQPQPPPAYPKALDATRRFPTRKIGKNEYADDTAAKKENGEDETEVDKNERSRHDMNEATKKEGNCDKESNEGRIENGEADVIIKTEEKIESETEGEGEESDVGEEAGLAGEVSQEEATELLNTFVPYPIQRSFHFVMRGDKRVVAWLHKQMNGIMTLIILFLLVSVLLSLPVFFVVKFSEETAIFRDYAAEMWHSSAKHKVTQQIKDLQSEEIADAVQQFIQRWPEEARMWAERKLKESTGYDIPLAVLQETFNQFWANGVKSQQHHHNQTTHHQPIVAAANNSSSNNNTCALESKNESDNVDICATEYVDKTGDVAVATPRDLGQVDEKKDVGNLVVDIPQQAVPSNNASASPSNFLFKLTSLWWTSMDHQPPQREEKGEGDDEGDEGAMRLTDIQALFSREGFINFFKANANVLASVWNYLKFNFTLLLGWILNTLWSTGQRVFNFLFSIILFFTTLFYLLAASDDRGSYIPFKWFLFIFPKDGGTRVMVQEAITQAINEVFLSLVKISIFHALWTWLTLTILGVRIVYISTFLTLLFVIFPVIGPYWVSLPACLELWLVGKPVHAVVLFCLHLAAAWYIDPKIYSEIKMGHYYVTGLAVVGGLYFLGLEGVIIGPTVLCVLLFLYKILNKLLNP